MPATVNKEMDGFALNRLQGALLAEAFTVGDVPVVPLPLVAEVIGD